MGAQTRRAKRYHKNIEMLYKTQEKVIKLYDDYSYKIKQLMEKN